MAFNFIQTGEIDQSAVINHLLSTLCENDKFADVTFIVEGTKIPAHKTILSVRSFYFESMFGDNFADGKKVEIELKVPLDAFRVILKYFYTGCLSLTAFEWNEIVEVYDLANQYGFDALKEIILEYLTPKLTLENCVEILKAAQLYSLHDLENACLRFMDSNSTELLGHETFIELPLSSLCNSLERDSFYAPEVEIFNAICKWYTSNPDADIKEALSRVRWSELSTNELFDVIIPSKILDEKELWELMKVSSNKKSGCRIPSSERDADINIATAKYGAKTISGENPLALLDANFTDCDTNTKCTYHSMASTDVYTDNKLSEKLDSFITVDLGDVKFINFIQMLLYHKDGRSYSYYVDVSLDGLTFSRLFDYTQEYRISRQYLYFPSRPIRFIKLVGTRAIGILNKRTGYSKNINYNGYSHSSQSYIQYDSFDVVDLKAMYKTTYIPKLINGLIKPVQNIARVEYGATVVKGVGGNKMLNLKLGDFTCHEIGSDIILRLNQAYIINSLRMLLGNSLNHSNKYSFFIETSLNKKDWEMAVDKRDETLSGLQEFDFTPRPVAYIKIAGTQKDVNFICTYFECPRNLQKPSFKRPHS